LKSGLDKKESRNILERLTTCMEKEKPYIDCDLNIRELSSKIKTSPHKLSQVINEQMNHNFFEFVNSYRVEEVKKALIDPTNKNFKIMSIAYDCGFNSKSAFYNIFKKHTNLTPSAYRDQRILQKISS